MTEKAIKIIILIIVAESISLSLGKFKSNQFSPLFLSANLYIIIYTILAKDAFLKIVARNDAKNAAIKHSGRVFKSE